MLLPIALILMFQTAGIAIENLFGLTVPGPVMGLLLYLASLFLYPKMRELTMPVVNFLLSHMVIFFVPAGVGLMQYFDLLSREWLAITASIVGSSIIALVTTILVTRTVSRLMQKKGADHA